MLRQKPANTKVLQWVPTPVVKAAASTYSPSEYVCHVMQSHFGVSYAWVEVATDETVFI